MSSKKSKSSGVSEDVKKQVQSALMIASGRDPYLALSIIEALPEDALPPAKYNEVIEYISSFISAGPGAGAGTGSG